MKEREHWSDCAVYNGPALPVGDCDCGEAPKSKTGEEIRERLKDAAFELREMQALYDYDSPDKARSESEVDTLNWVRDVMFCCYLRAIQEELHATARDKGWWDTDRNDGELIALLHSELSELLEALRHGNPPDANLPAFSSAEVEAADVMIRLLDMAEARGWRLGEAVIAKAEYNRGREWKHGGKKF